MVAIFCLYLDCEKDHNKTSGQFYLGLFKCQLHFILKRRASTLKSVLILQPRAVKPPINGIPLPLFSKNICLSDPSEFHIMGILCQSRHVTRVPEKIHLDVAIQTFF